MQRLFFIVILHADCMNEQQYCPMHNGALASAMSLHQRDVLTTILQRGNETIIPYNCLSVIKYLNVEMADSGRHAAQNNDVEMRKLLTESGAKLKEAL